jgi:hypothetical protein
VLRREPDKYSYLDVAQLVKHYLGLSRCYHGRQITLLYLFWEPANAVQLEIYALHRQELDQFARTVAGDDVRFVAQSHQELWQYWAGLTAPHWLPHHTEWLMARYAASI